MRCGENPVHERMNSIAENNGAVKTIRRGRIANGMSRKESKHKSSRAIGFKDGLVRDCTVASKNDLPNFCLSDTLFKSVRGGIATRR